MAATRNTTIMSPMTIKLGMVMKINPHCRKGAGDNMLRPPEHDSSTMALSKYGAVRRSLGGSCHTFLTEGRWDVSAASRCVLGILPQANKGAGVCKSFKNAKQI